MSDYKMRHSGESSPVIYEGRLVPGVIAAFSLVFSILVSISFDFNSWEIAIVVFSILISIWFSRRCARPHKIIHIEAGWLNLHDLPSGLVTRIHLSEVISLGVKRVETWGVGAEGGIGFRDELIIETASKTITFPLPILEMSAEKVIPIIERERKRSVTQKR